MKDKGNLGPGETKTTQEVLRVLYSEMRREGCQTIRKQSVILRCARGDSSTVEGRVSKQETCELSEDMTQGGGQVRDPVNRNKGGRNFRKQGDKGDQGTRIDVHVGIQKRRVS